MINTVSQNTQAILLLTAPLIAGKKLNYSNLLSLGEYNKLARFLHEIKKQPSDLLQPASNELIDACGRMLDSERLKRLLNRGFLLSQVLNDWRDRSIWVVSRADSVYPRKLKSKLKEDAPPVLYGCGNISISETEGLAIVGSRDVDDYMVKYAKDVAKLSVQAGKTIYSGGARGIDQAGMLGAIESSGRAVGIVADTLEKSALNRVYRDALIGERLLLISPFDPRAGFNVGNAMNRNKLIYALANCALVVNSDFNKGGTWNGVVEQLSKLHYCDVYVRSTEEPSKGLEALTRRGAMKWPNPTDVDSFANILASGLHKVHQKPLEKLFANGAIESRIATTETIISNSVQANSNPSANNLDPAEELFEKVKELVIFQLATPKSNDELSKILGVSSAQVKAWLQRLLNESVVSHLPKTKRYALKID